MRPHGSVSYQEMLAKKVKAQLARDRKLVLRYESRSPLSAEQD